MFHMALSIDIFVIPSGSHQSFLRCLGQGTSVKPTWFHHGPWNSDLRGTLTHDSAHCLRLHRNPLLSLLVNHAATTQYRYQPCTQPPLPSSRLSGSSASPPSSLTSAPIIPVLSRLCSKARENAPAASHASTPAPTRWSRCPWPTAGRASRDARRP